VVKNMCTGAPDLVGEQREPVSGRRLPTSEHSPAVFGRLGRPLTCPISLTLEEPMTDPTAWVCKPWQSRPPLRDARPFDPAGSPAGFRLREGVAMFPVSRRQRITPAKCRCKPLMPSTIEGLRHVSAASYEVTAGSIIEDIRRATRKYYSATTASRELCRRRGRKKRPARDKARAATSDEVHAPAKNPGVK
jgi:hypothetical protein